MMLDEARAEPALSCDVLIVGASFAGLEVYRQLRRTPEGCALEVMLVDRQAQHGYIPLAHERLTDRLTMDASTLPTERCVACDPRARYIIDHVISMDASRGLVQLRSGRVVCGRFVVIALGSELAPPQQLQGHAQLLRYKFAAELDATKNRLRHALEQGTPVVVVGGGISGVELAGDIAHRARRIGPTHGRVGLQAPAHSHVTLVEASDHLVAELHPRLGRHALRKLTAQGVEVKVGAKVIEVLADGAKIQRGPSGPVETVSGVCIWAAGVRPNPLLAALGLPLTATGYLAVPPSLQCRAGTSSTAAEVFACGDAVRIVDGEREWPTMQRAIECLWQAGVVGENILARCKGASQGSLRLHKLRRSFPYGISIGTASAIVFGRFMVELGALGIWFRRFLMRQYLRRYTCMTLRARRSPLLESDPTRDARERRS